MGLHTVSIVVYEHGAIKIIAKYIQLRNNTYYFRRRLPDDVARHYPNKRGFLFFSLGTKDKLVAAKSANLLAQQQDALWKAFRSGGLVHGPDEREAAFAFLERFGLKPGQRIEADLNGVEPDDFMDELRHLSQDDRDPPTIIMENLPRHVRLAADLYNGAKVVPTLSETLDLHLKLSGVEGDDKTDRARRYAIGRLVALVGDLPVDQYRREHANAFVQMLLETGIKTTTVKRYLNYISPVFKTGITEHELNKQNVFHDLKIPNFRSDAKKREVFSLEEIAQLQQLCRNKDDPLRYAVSIISDTGMRLSEVVGLRREDIHIDGPIPHIALKPNAARRLKGPRSTRLVPLVGMAFWGARNILEKSGTGYLFPQYFSEGVKNGGGASATLNKWVKEQGIDKTMHCLRHSMRDRLRNENVPADVINKLCGWVTPGVGENYGDGYDLIVLFEWMKKIVKEPIVN